MLNQEMADLFPAPPSRSAARGVNAFAAQIYEELPVAFTREERIFVQMDQESGKRAAVWQMEQRATREAAEIFVNGGYLDRFLDLVWHRRT